MLIVIPCGASKLPHPAPGRELYTGAMFKMALRAAEALQARQGGEIVILSGLHGFVALGQELAPYEQRIDEPGAVGVDSLKAWAADAGLGPGAEVVVLAGQAYSSVVRAIWPHAKAPLLGLGGIGYQRRRLGQITRGEFIP